MKQEHLLSAGKRRKISSSALNLNEPVLICTLLRCSGSCKRVIREHGLQRGLSKPFLPPWLSKSVKIRLFYPRRLPWVCTDPSRPHEQSGGIGSPSAPALRVQHLLPAGPPAPRLPREGEDETHPCVPTGVTEKPGALGDLEIALGLNETRMSPPQWVPAQPSPSTVVAGLQHPQPPGCPAPHHPPTLQAASRLWCAPHYF